MWSILIPHYIKKMFWNKKLFTADLYRVVVSWSKGSSDVLMEQDMDLLPL